MIRYLALFTLYALLLPAQRPVAVSEQKTSDTCTGLKGEWYQCRITNKALLFQFSLDQGRSWSGEQIIAPVSNGPDSTQINYSAPAIRCDLGNGSYRGRIYACWSDVKNGLKNKDVFLVYSDDSGASWTEPILITYRPNHKSQFDPALHLGSGGRVYLSYFDQQNYPEEGFADLYLAISDNGGLLFFYQKMNATSIKLKPGVLFMNRFLGHPPGLFVAWDEWGKKSAPLHYRVVINDSLPGAFDRVPPERFLIVDKTFPFSQKTHVYFQVRQPVCLTAILTKPLEPGFEKTVIKKRKFSVGRQSLRIDADRLGLPKGNYILTLYFEGKNIFAWILDQ